MLKKVTRPPEVFCGAPWWSRPLKWESGPLICLQGGMQRLRGIVHNTESFSLHPPCWHLQQINQFHSQERISFSDKFTEAVQHQLPSPLCPRTLQCNRWPWPSPGNKQSPEQIQVALTFLVEMRCGRVLCKNGSLTPLVAPVEATCNLIICLQWCHSVVNLYFA